MSFKQFFITLIIIAAVVGLTVALLKLKSPNASLNHSFGDKLDSLNGVYVYYNGSVSTVKGRNLAPGGYNLGLKYQCVEFVKRYYYEVYNHKMRNSYGHAKDFFNKQLKDGAYNSERGLLQFTNPSSSKPQVNDLVVFKGNVFNAFGHVAIVSKVEDNRLEIIQQNVGRFGNTRAFYKLLHNKGKWRIKSEDLVGWLRKK